MGEEGEYRWIGSIIDANHLITVIKIKTAQQIK